LSSFITQLQNTAFLIEQNLGLSLWIIAGLWLILLLNKMLGYRLNWLGVLPRHFFGLVGIPLHPFIHGSFNHLFFNSIPLFVLLTLMLALGLPAFLCATILIVLLNGSLLWLFGRKSIHLGASGLIMGYWGYLLLLAYAFPSVLTFILAIICVYYFGSLLLSVFPSEARVSWEGHLFGLLSGIATAYICSIMDLRHAY
jgi:membrane associated rhomboid family serine protease